MEKPPKLKTLAELSRLAKKIKSQNKKIVLAHGVFDLIHWGHIHYLKEAKKLGDILVVSLVNDKFVGKSNVTKRPLLFKEQIRIEWLAEFETVDFVSLSQDTGPWKVMRAIRPDFYAKGDDSKKRLSDKNSSLQKDKIQIEKLGGKLVFTKSLPIHSTEILKSLKT